MARGGRRPPGLAQLALEHSGPNVSAAHPPAEGSLTPQTTVPALVILGKRRAGVLHPFLRQ